MARFIAVLSMPGAMKMFHSEWVYNHRHWFDKFEVTRRTLTNSSKPLRHLTYFSSL